VVSAAALGESTHRMRFSGSSTYHQYLDNPECSPDDGIAHSPTGAVQGLDGVMLPGRQPNAITSSP
jgi:hypothetical protein